VAGQGDPTLTMVMSPFGVRPFLEAIF
jgi:hypothetical protein